MGRLGIPSKFLTQAADAQKNGPLSALVEATDGGSAPAVSIGTEDFATTAVMACPAADADAADGFTERSFVKADDLDSNRSSSQFQGNHGTAMKGVSAATSARI